MYYDHIWARINHDAYFEQHLKNTIFSIRKILGVLEIRQPSNLEVGYRSGNNCREPLKLGKIRGMDILSVTLIILRGRYLEFTFLEGNVLNYGFIDSTFTASEII